MQHRLSEQQALEYTREDILGEWQTPSNNHNNMIRSVDLINTNTHGVAENMEIKQYTENGNHEQKDFNHKAFFHTADN